MLSRRRWRVERRRIVGLVLAPHYSGMSIGGYRERLEEALAGRAELVLVESWHDEPAFLDVLAERVHGTDAWVVFTAHSLTGADPRRRRPLSRTAPGDREPRGGAGRARALVVRLPERGARPGSRGSGRTCSRSSSGCRQTAWGKVLVAPVGFVSDHLEILWALDVEAREKAEELGLELSRIESLNDDPAFVRALANVVERAQQEQPAGRKVAAMSSRTCPDWPDLMELAPELQFMHYTVAEAKLPSEALAELVDVPLESVAICADLDRNVFYAHHTDPQVAEALRNTHWFELHEWHTRGPGTAEG